MHSEIGSRYADYADTVKDPIVGIIEHEGVQYSALRGGDLCDRRVVADAIAV